MSDDGIHRLFADRERQAQEIAEKLMFLATTDHCIRIVLNELTKRDRQRILRRYPEWANLHAEP